MSLVFPSFYPPYIIRTMDSTLMVIVDSKLSVNLDILMILISLFPREVRS